MHHHLIIGPFLTIIDLMFVHTKGASKNSNFFVTGFCSSATAPGVALGLRSRLDSTDYIHVIVPPASLQSCKIGIRPPWTAEVSKMQDAIFDQYILVHKSKELDAS